MTKKRSKALCQKVGFRQVFVIVRGTPASGLAVSTNMCVECAPNRAVSHKIEVAQHWKHKICLRQDQVALSSVVQSAQLKKWYTLGNWLQVFHGIHIAKTYEKKLFEPSRGGMLMESIALDTAACPKCVENASSFGSVCSCFSKLAHGTAKFAVTNAVKQTCSLEV